MAKEIYSIYFYDEDVEFNASLKYSIEGDTIRVSIPNFRTDMKKEEGRINKVLKEKLRDCGWHEKAIKMINKILFPNNHKYLSNVWINPKTGKLTVDCDGPEIIY